MQLVSDKAASGIPEFTVGMVISEHPVGHCHQTFVIFIIISEK
jgi:hypothetical protein